MHLRSATADDQTTIQRMVRAARLDPTQLNWQNFVVAEIDGQIAGIGQVRRHVDCNELGSMITLKSYRGQGVARTIIAELEQRAGLPLYLICPASRQSFYVLSGFVPAGYRKLPWSLRLKMVLPLLARPFGIKIVTMMKR